MATHNMHTHIVSSTVPQSYMYKDTYTLAFTYIVTHSDALIHTHTHTRTNFLPLSHTVYSCTLTQTDRLTHKHTLQWKPRHLKIPRCFWVSAEESTNVCDGARRRSAAALWADGRMVPWFDVSATVMFHWSLGSPNQTCIMGCLRWISIIYTRGSDIKMRVTHSL